MAVVQDFAALGVVVAVATVVQEVVAVAVAQDAVHAAALVVVAGVVEEDVGSAAVLDGVADLGQVGLIAVVQEVCDAVAKDAVVLAAVVEQEAVGATSSWMEISVVCTSLIPPLI